VSEAIDDARRLIESRLADIDAEARQLKRAVTSMGKGGRRGRPPRSRNRVGAVGSAPSKPKRRVARKPGAGKRAARGQRREELLAALEANPGGRPSELAKQMGVRPTQVSVLIAKARADKLVVKKGEGYALKA
jgi:hypothetical protein